MSIPIFNKRNIVVFDHIRKCSGNSINRHFYNIFGKNHCEYLQQWAFPVNINQDKFISGHEIWGVHELFPEFQFEYFTFLREPKEIAISSFAYLKSVSKSNLTFEEFITQHYDNNFLVKHLGRGSLNYSIQRLKKYFFIGFVNQFELSMNALNEIISNRISMSVKYDISAPKLNVSKSRPEFSKSLLKYFIEQNIEDIELYQYAEDNYGLGSKKCFLTVQKNNPVTGQELSFSYSKKNQYIRLKSEKNILLNLIAPYDEDHTTIPTQGLSHEIILTMGDAIKYDDPQIVKFIFNKISNQFKQFFLEKVMRYFIFSKKDINNAKSILQRTEMSIKAPYISAVNCFDEAFRIYELFKCYVENDGNGIFRDLISHSIKKTNLEFSDRPEYELLIDFAIFLDMGIELLEHAQSLLTSIYWNRSIEKCLSRISLFFFRNENFQLSFKCLHKIMSQNKLSFDALQRLTVINRIAKTYPDVAKEVTDFCRQVPGGALEAKLQKEHFINRFQNDDDPYSIADLSLPSQYIESLYKTHYAKIYSTIPIETIFRNQERLFVVACCPDPLLDIIINTYLQTTKCEIDILLKKESVSLLEKCNNIRSTFFFKSLNFSYKSDKLDFDHFIKTKNYSNSLILTSSFISDGYNDILKFVSEYSICTTFFTLDQLFTSFKNQLFVYSKRGALCVIES